MIVGWITKTATGVRLWESQRGRYFRDVAYARSRESVLRKKQSWRSCAALRRDPYLMNRQHLDGNHVAVRITWGVPDKAA